METPRDRDGTFSPKLVKKHQTTLSDEIEQKIIALYGFGMSYNDIAAHLKEIYGLEISNGTLSAVTDKIIQTVKEWQARPLENVYPIVWLDAIHYKPESRIKRTLFGGYPQVLQEQSVSGH